MSDLEHQLQVARPAVRPVFRHQLRARLVARRPGVHRPPHLLRTVGGLMALGLVVLGIAAALI
jgi:hypothetical protein